MSMKRTIRNLGKAALGAGHRLGLKAGLFILPKHYYVPLADQSALRRTRATWAGRSAMHGVHWSVDEQRDYLTATVAPYASEYAGNRAYLESASSGPGFGYVEAQCLHGVLRSLKPKRIIEVGSGVSTRCMLHATGMNRDLDSTPAEVTCVEPYPSDFLKGSPEITLVASRVEEVDPALFDTLEAGDFLFIDSSHALRPKGDVEFLYLEVIPRLKAGVTIQIHDIYLPYTYQPDIEQTLFQWTETVLLQALLTDNARLKVLLSLPLLHHDAPEALLEVFPEYVRKPLPDGLAGPGEDGHFPASIYLLTV
jgi:predicted O-methyltransferase YrrM